MRLGRRELAVVWLTLLCGGLLDAQTDLSGRVIDETGAGVAGAAVEFRGGVLYHFRIHGLGREFPGDPAGRGGI